MLVGFLGRTGRGFFRPPTSLTSSTTIAKKRFLDGYDNAGMAKKSNLLGRDDGDSLVKIGQDFKENEIEMNAAMRLQNEFGVKIGTKIKHKHGSVGRIHSVRLDSVTIV